MQKIVSLLRHCWRVHSSDSRLVYRRTVFGETSGVGALVLSKEEHNVVGDRWRLCHHGGNFDHSTGCHLVHHSRRPSFLRVGPTASRKFFWRRSKTGSGGKRTTGSSGGSTTAAGDYNRREEGRDTSGAGVSEGTSGGAGSESRGALLRPKFPPRSRLVQVGGDDHFRPVADPDMFLKGRRKTMYQPSCRLSQMHIMNCTRFVLGETATYWKKFWGKVREASAPPPLNPPLLSAVIYRVHQACLYLCMY